jgi:hypothetical protein
LYLDASIYKEAFSGVLVQWNVIIRNNIDQKNILQRLAPSISGFSRKSKASHCREKHPEFQVRCKVQCNGCSHGRRHALPLLFTKKASYGIIVWNSSAPELSLSDMSKRFCAETPQAKSVKDRRRFARFS